MANNEFKIFNLDDKKLRQYSEVCFNCGKCRLPPNDNHPCQRCVEIGRLGLVDCPVTWKTEIAVLEKIDLLLTLYFLPSVDGVTVKCFGCGGTHRIGRNGEVR